MAASVSVGLLKKGVAAGANRRRLASGQFVDQAF
jgi:hypothetical protein